MLIGHRLFHLGHLRRESTQIEVKFESWFTWQLIQGQLDLGDIILNRFRFRNNLVYLFTKCVNSNKQKAISPFFSFILELQPFVYILLARQKVLNQLNCVKALTFVIC